MRPGREQLIANVVTVMRAAKGHHSVLNQFTGLCLPRPEHSNCPLSPPRTDLMKPPVSKITTRPGTVISNGVRVRCRCSYRHRCRPICPRKPTVSNLRIIKHHRRQWRLRSSLASLCGHIDGAPANHRRRPRRQTGPGGALCLAGYRPDAVGFGDVCQSDRTPRGNRPILHG